MVVTWAVLFTALLVLGFGTASLVLGVTHTQYGHYIERNNIMRIEYRNGYRSKDLMREMRVENSLHQNAFDEILNLLQRAGRTNNLSNLFRGNPDETIERNTLSASHTSTFYHLYGQNSIIIWFAPQRTQFFVRQYSLNDFGFYERAHHTAQSNDTNVYAIAIPLVNTSNTFQSQTWYLVTRNEMAERQGTSLQIANVIQTHGNYYHLWNFVNGLSLF